MVSTCKNESPLIVLDDVQTFEVTLGSNATVPSHLPSEINAADIEIRWFKGTDCVCLYMEEQVIVGVDYKGRVNLKMEERENISLELQDFRESDDGDYLCQVTRGGKTEMIREVRLSSKTNKSTKTLQSEKKTTLEKIDEMKMEKSVLMAVITELKETKQECKKKDAEIKKLKAQLPQTVEEPEENTQQENMHKPAEKLDNSEFNQDNPETKTTPLEKLQNIDFTEEVKVFTYYSGNTNELHEAHKTFIDTLRKQIVNLREVDTLPESDITLIFCPVSQTETEVDAALKRLKGDPGFKLALLVVLHPITDPKKPVPGSSQRVKTDILTVDWLFNEDTEFLECQENSDAVDKVVNWLRQQKLKASAKVCPLQGQQASSLTMNEGESESVQRESSEPKFKDKCETLEKANQKFEEKDAQTEKVKTAGEPVKNKTQQENMHKSSKESKSSELNQANPETKPLEKQQLNIEEVKMFTVFTGNADALQKPHKKFIGLLQKQIRTLSEVYTSEESNVVLIFCPAVSRVGTNIDSALKIHENNTGSKLAVLVVLHRTFEPEKVVPDSSQYVKRTDILTVDCLFNEDTGLLACQRNSDAADKVVNWFRQQEKKQKTSGHNTQQMIFKSSSTVNYFVSVTGDAQEHHEHFMNDLQKGINMKRVHTVQESDVILLFCPDITEYAQKDKPVVIISLYHTKDPEHDTKSSAFQVRRTLFPVDCIFIKGKGLLDCPMNKTEVSAVFDFLKKKVIVKDGEQALEGQCPSVRLRHHRL